MSKQSEEDWGDAQLVEPRKNTLKESSGDWGTPPAVARVQTRVTASSQEQPTMIPPPLPPPYNPQKDPIVAATATTASRICDMQPRPQAVGGRRDPVKMVDELTQWEQSARMSIATIDGNVERVARTMQSALDKFDTQVSEKTAVGISKFDGIVSDRSEQLSSGIATMCMQATDAVVRLQKNVDCLVAALDLSEKQIERHTNRIRDRAKEIAFDARQSHYPSRSWADGDAPPPIKGRRYEHNDGTCWKITKVLGTCCVMLFALISIAMIIGFVIVGAMYGKNPTK